jgi:hypothetical protein
MITTLRTSKFFVSFYGDSVAEKEFYAKNCRVTYENNDAVFSLELMHLLDYSYFVNWKNDFDTLSIEDVFLRNNLKAFLLENKKIKYFKICIQANTKKTEIIRKIKFNTNEVLFIF